MDLKDKISEDRELAQVSELLTPKFRRKCEFTFTKPRKRIINRIFAVSGIAAMVAVILTVAIKSVMTVSATEVINSAWDNLSNAESVKVEFLWRGVKTSADEIYSPNPFGSMINGTLYLLRKDGKVYARIDWHDVEKNSIVFTGKEYMHMKNNKVINRHPSSFKDLTGLLNQSTVPQDLKNGSVIEEDGNRIIMTTHKDAITLCGEYQRDSKQLTKASAIAKSPDGEKIIIFETKSIETQIDIPDNFFSE